MSLLSYPLNPQMLAEEEAVMIEEMEVQENKDVVLIPVDKRNIERSAHIVTF